MQYKIITILAFTATALTVPAPEPTDPSEYYDSNISEVGSLLLDYLNLPSSIRTVLATAIPPSFYVDILDPASSSSILNEVSAGNFPAWYSSLPSSVKAWATTAFEDNTLSGPATDSSVSVTASSAVAVSTSANTSANPTGLNAVKISQISTSAARARSTSDASSSSASASASNSQSTGGAPGPNGGVVTGVASVAGILALVLAL